MPVRLTRSAIEERKLRLDEGIVYRLTVFDDMSDTDAERNAVIVFLQIVHADQSSTKIGATARLIKRKRLECSNLHVITVIVTGSEARRIQLVPETEKGLAKRTRNWFAQSSESVNFPMS